MQVGSDTLAAWLAVLQSVPGSVLALLDIPGGPSGAGLFSSKSTVRINRRARPPAQARRTSTRAGHTRHKHKAKLACAARIRDVPALSHVSRVALAHP